MSVRDKQMLCWQQCILAIEAMVPPAELDAWPTIVEPELARLLLEFQKASIKHT
ncbi:MULTISPECIES: hypothetical protein [unclassified Streptosporangium]|uniref:hypothetical protein n=1 Tax=unclassified Streptosporangium TaxID=2632669 RepID=UPI002E2CC22E|nr:MULTISPECIES: hypothetical protein [unclassified Streptosporangium]